MSGPGAPPPLGPLTTVLPAANQDDERGRLPEALSAGDPAHATTISSDGQRRHVVKILVNTADDVSARTLRLPAVGYGDTAGCVRISVGGGGQDMVRRVAVHPAERGAAGNPYFFCNGLQCSGATTVISSGQSSPSDTLDSGTCSDLDGGTPPPPPPKKRSSAASAASAAVTVTVNGGGRRERAGSLSSGAEVDGSDDDDDDDDRISCDSLNSGGTSHPGSDESFDGPARFEATATITLVNNSAVRLGPRQAATGLSDDDSDGRHAEGRRAGDHSSGAGLPAGLLQDIRERTSKLSISPTVDQVPAKKTKSWCDTGLPAKPRAEDNKHPPLSPSSSASSSADEAGPRRCGSIVQERTYEDRKKECEDKEKQKPRYDLDMFYKFHINERFDEPAGPRAADEDGAGDSFAGYKDLLEGKQASATIRSAKGTVRGVRNRVRAGITTFLQLHATKSYKEKEAGKVVLYTTTMGVVRRTYQDCVKVKKILRNLMVKYEERDVFMSREVQAEIRDRLNTNLIVVPQMFVEGQLVGDAEAIEKLNESGELRRFLKPYRSPDACSECRVCGGYRLLPCPVCSGSKKSVHRNHFTAEFVALKCMNCDEVGLVRCHAC